MAQLLIDTDVLIDYLRDRAEAVTFLETLTSSRSISAITVAELYAGVREGAERAALDQFVSSFQVIAVDENIATPRGNYSKGFWKESWYWLGRCDHCGYGGGAASEPRHSKQQTLSDDESRRGPL